MATAKVTFFLGDSFTDIDQIDVVFGALNDVDVGFAEELWAWLDASDWEEKSTDVTGQ